MRTRFSLSFAIKFGGFLIIPIPLHSHRRMLRVAACVRMQLSSQAMSKSEAKFEGFRISPGYLDSAAQQDLVAQLRALIAEAPLYNPVMPRTGKPFSVRMTNLGPLGWVSDRAGYRYQPEHPVTGKPWPDIPARLLEIWQDLTHWPAPPECCLVNYYAAEGARMGLHRMKMKRSVAHPCCHCRLAIRPYSGWAVLNARARRDRSGSRRGMRWSWKDRHAMPITALIAFLPVRLHC